MLDTPRPALVVSADKAYDSEKVRQHIKDDGALPYDVAEVRARLAGRDLACWCPQGEPCHADVLLHWANGAPPGAAG